MSVGAVCFYMNQPYHAVPEHRKDDTADSSGAILAGIKKKFSAVFSQMRDVPLPQIKTIRYSGSRQLLMASNK